MEVQHTHTEFLATFGRRLDGAVREANQELERSREDNARAWLQWWSVCAGTATRQSARDRA